MRRVGPDTYVLGTRSHNFYVLREGDDATIIDAGCSREWSKLLGGLRSIGLSIEAIRGIVVTHSHADHFGFAKQATSEGVPVSVHTDEESRARGTYTGRYSVSANELPMFSLATVRNFLPLVSAGAMSLEHPDDVGIFEDGQALDLPGHPVAIHTPGHTEGHTMFHSPDRGILFTGDGLVTLDLLGARRGPQMLEQRFHHDSAQAMASLDRIAGLEADLLLPGHGVPWRGSPRDAVALVRG